MRGGNYLQLKNDFGLLSVDYYEKSIEHIMQFFGESPVWVFTNDTDYSRSLFSDQRFQYLEYANVPNGTPDSETMIAMSYAQKIIISNSTFA